MSENEKLIEWARSGNHLATRPGLVLELADALEATEKAHTTTPPDGWFYMGSHVGAPWLNLEFSEEMDETGLPLWERPVQHTPTDDEREAVRLRAALEDVWSTIQRDVRVLANLDPAELGGIVARALESSRSEVPEPSTGQVNDVLVLLEDAIDNIDYPGADTLEWIGKAKAHAATLARWARPEPQGEPSDAEAWAAAHAFAVALKEQTGRPQMVNVEHARAALRAAGGVR